MLEYLNSEIVSVIAAVFCVGLIVNMVVTTIKDRREHRRFMERLHRSQGRIARDAGKDS